MIASLEKLPSVPPTVQLPPASLTSRLSPVFRSTLLLLRSSPTRYHALVSPDPRRFLLHCNPQKHLSSLENTMKPAKAVPVAETIASDAT